MLEGALRPPQTEPHHVEILTPLPLPLLLLRVHHQLRQTQRRFQGLSRGQVSEGGSTGVKSEDGILECAAAGALGIRSAERKSGGLHVPRAIEYLL